MAQAQDENADTFIAAAKREVGKRSGRLANSITKKVVKGTDGLVVRISTSVFYARFEEFGTVNRPANPFWFVVFRALRPAFKRRYNKAQREGIKESLS